MTREDSLMALEQEVGVLLRRVKRVIGERARAVHEGLQPAAYLMLGYVAEHGPIRASAMAGTFDTDKGAISRQVTHLMELGLVTGSPDPDDGRATLLTVTDEARRRMEDVRIHRRRWVDEQLGGWSDERLAAFVRELGSYNEALTPAEPPLR